MDRVSTMPTEMIRKEVTTDERSKNEPTTAIPLPVWGAVAAVLK